MSIAMIMIAILCPIESHTKLHNGRNYVRRLYWKRKRRVGAHTSLFTIGTGCSFLIHKIYNVYIVNLKLGIDLN